MRPTIELAQLLQSHWPKLCNSAFFNSYQLRTLDALARCRTASLGGHLDACSACGLLRISYNSCRNRHCPKCQNLQKEEWMLAREAELLPVSYFHVVFTLPDSINPLALAYPAKVYNLLFQSAWQTIQTFAADPKHLSAKASGSSLIHYDRYLTYLGAEPLAPSPSALHRARWRHHRQWEMEKGQKPRKVLVSGKSSKQGLSS